MPDLLRRFSGFFHIDGFPVMAHFCLHKRNRDKCCHRHAHNAGNHKLSVGIPAIHRCNVKIPGVFCQLFMPMLLDFSEYLQLLYSVFTQSFNSASWTLPFNRRPSTIWADAETLFFNAEAVFPKPLPPEVANSTIFLPEKSYCSRNVLMIVGATYHQIGNPTNTVSY